VKPRPKPIRLVIVEDSVVARELLVRILSGDPEMLVVGSYRSAEDAIRALPEVAPDVITMDIHMPGMDGYEATRKIMETAPVPIVIVSATYDPEDVEKTFRALDAGAVAMVGKPRGSALQGGDAGAEHLVRTVRAMSGVRVLRRWPQMRKPAAPAEPPRSLQRTAEAVSLVAIGASTGGPPVLRTILAALPKPFPVPVVIVQHICTGFIGGMADWLTQTSGMTVRVAEDREIMEPGAAYLAPDGCQMRVGRGGRLLCKPDASAGGLCPAVSHLFQSAAEIHGRRAVGVLLTGMGRDGAAELKLMRDAGAVTIAQDKDSSVVHGMPGAAIELGAALHVCAPPRIAAILAALACPARPHPRHQ
jgi:two-component system, chemotaxis family, protein-glutamate methylesterase/glutaminase